MDKNKNRTDLLAAGRKKLQQFRQKKDVKGTSSPGKSSKKSSKSEQHESDGDAATTTAKSTALPQVLEGQTLSHIDSTSRILDSSVSNSTESSVAPVLDIVAGDPSSFSATLETSVAETALARNAGICMQEERVHENDIDSSDAIGGESSQIINDEVVTLEFSGIPDSEGETKCDGTFVSVDVPAHPAMVDTRDGMDIMVERKSTNWVKENDSMPSGQDTLDTSLIPGSRYQVTDVGAMQEADGLGSKQFGRSCGIEREGGGRLSLSEHDEIADTVESTALQQTGMDEAPTQLNQTDGSDDISASAIATDISDVYLVSASAISGADENLGAVHEVTSQHLEVVNAIPSNVQKIDILYESGHFGNNRVDFQEDGMDAVASNQQYMPEESFIFVGKSHEGCSMSSLGDACPISFSQLIEVIRGLSEDDYGFLLKSRGSVSNAELAAGSLISSQHGLPGLLDGLKEELVLTYCTKDILHLQVTEHSILETHYDCQFRQLDDEISALRVSLREALERNDYLAEQIAECRSELQETANGRGELQLQFHAAKAEVVELSARVFELQNSLECSQSDLFSLSKESSDWKDLVAALRVENENLNGNLASLTEERKELLDEKDACLSENEKLLKELADFRNLLASLQLEASNLSGTLASVTEEKKKLEGEREYLANGNEKLSMELSDRKSLVEALQVENANLSGNLDLVTEERNKLGEDKSHLVCENERLSSELLDLRERLFTVQADCTRLEVELQEVTLHLEQLTEENMFLKSSPDIQKANPKEIDDRQVQISSPEVEAANQDGSLAGQSMSCDNVSDDGHSHQIPGKGDGGGTFHVLEKSESDGLAEGTPSELFQQEVFDDCFGFVALKGHLQQVENIMLKLEKAVEGMHSHSASLSRSGDKMAAPAVSKLIQAFESKVHSDEHETEERAVIEDRSSLADPFVSTKELLGNLKAMLVQLAVDADNVNSVLKGERNGRSTANLTISNLNLQVESLKEHSHSLEATYIEHGVLYEAVKQHVSDFNEKNNELEVLYETLKQQNGSLRVEKSELGEKLIACESRTEELQSQLHDLEKSSAEMACVFCDQLENLQREAVDMALTVEQEWNSTIAQIIEAVERLADSIGFSVAPIPASSHGYLDKGNRVTAFVDAAIKMIEDLKEKLEVARTDHEATSNLFKEVNWKYNKLLGENELANDALHKLYFDLRKLVIDSCEMVGENEINKDVQLPDLVNYNRYKTLMDQLENFLAERLQLQSVNKKMNLELMSRTDEVEELNRRCLDVNSIQKLIEDVQGVVKLEDAGISLDRMPVSQLESLVSFLVDKYKEAAEQISSSRQEYTSKMVELTELRGEIDRLTELKLQCDNDILLLKEQINQTEEALLTTRSELQEKVSELEQSEQRVSSIREKLSIAVAKGKGLIVQRDSLKQSLAETSNELERCSQELQLKDVRLHEVETRLKTYSEAGERVEALESELSYIRNSATALRESFLLKDSVLQRIEEILEDLDLSEHFHSKDIIEKVDWLAKSVTGNSLPQTDWDQKSSVGGSYSDTGFVVMDAWKEDVQQGSNSGDDLRRKHEELQTKFYGLAEQNEMLEQSLMERNHLVQRWEELLDRINMPSHLRSVEPEDRIEWLGSALSEADHDRNSLLEKIDQLENYCGSLTSDMEQSQKRVSYLDAELEESQRRTYDLEMELQAVVHEKETLSGKLNILTFDHEKLLAKAVQFELDNGKLQNEVSGLQEKLVEKIRNEEHIQSIYAEVSRLQDLVCDALQEPDIEDLMSGGSVTGCLEGLLRKLIEKYTNLSLVKPVFGDAVENQHGEKADTNLAEGSGTVDSLNTEESDIAFLNSDKVDTEEPKVDVLKKELEESLSELMHVKEERDRYIEKQRMLVSEVETLDRKRLEFQELLNQEEQKSAAIREKLNVAVRKGKSLVQQRDSMKQTIEEMNTELEHLKSGIKQRENALADYEQKMGDLIVFSQRVEALESESLVLRSHLSETENLLQEKENSLTKVLNTIDVGSEISNSEPIEKLEHIGKVFRDLHAAVASSEQESRKSRRAAELLLAELNEVQERNDGLQEELSKAITEFAELSKERNEAETTKLEALSHLEKLSMVQSEEKKKQRSEIVVLNSALNQLRKTFADMNNLISDIFSKDLEFLQSLEAVMESSLKRVDANHVIHVPIFPASAGFTSSNSGYKENSLSLDFSWQTSIPDNFDDDSISKVSSSVQEFMTEIDALKVMSHEHSVILSDRASNLSKLMGFLHSEMTSQKESFEAMKRDIKHIESIDKEKEMEIVILRRNITLLYEACTSSLVEIENRRAEAVGKTLSSGDLGLVSKPATFADEVLPYGGESKFSSEEHIKMMAERLLLLVKDFADLKGKVMEDNKKEMEITLLNLQKELQEKDIQRERICMELVSQIREAEANVRSYSQDLQSSKTHMHDLEKQVEMMEEERVLLQHRVEELQDGQAISAELHERVRSLNNMLLAKDQEIEALMQALDEEDIQMEALRNKMYELEKILNQKNSDIETLDASRGKAVKKLSSTVNKFDELHHFSESLLAEVEKLQVQLKDRDAEISFLRQEVTRCTNDVLVASQMSSKRNSDEIHELLTWLVTLVSQVGIQDLSLDDISQVHEYKEILQKKIPSIFSELEDLRVVAQSRDALLQMERNKVEQLTLREKTLEKSLREKESQLNMLEGFADLGQPPSETSEISEVEPVINKRSIPGPSTASQVRSLRKINNDQVAIAIDMEPGGSTGLEDEDDNKVHGFKSLTTSRIVPKFTRPVTDMIDGLWVSWDRALMRQPALRLGIILYWAILHALLAAFVV